MRRRSISNQHDSMPMEKSKKNDGDNFVFERRVSGLMSEYVVIRTSGGYDDLWNIFIIVMLVIIIGSYLLSCMGVEIGGSNEDALIYAYYEAEAEENTFGGETACTASSGCSGGEKVSYIGNDESSTLTFNGIEVEEEGNYEVLLFYCSGEERTVYYSVNGGEFVSVETLDTGGSDQTGVVTFAIKLETGTNTIAFGNAKSYAPDIDRIGIRYLSETGDDAEMETHYYTYYDIDCTWEEAKSMCEEMGGHLVTISSESEQEIVKYLLNAAERNSYWLGGYRSGESFNWITGEDFSYSNWATGQPDNAMASEDALMMYRQTDDAWGTWNDLNSDGTCNNSDEDFFGTENIGFVCEWES